METRRRAPQREGQRTTLRVPTALVRSAEALARELGTTTNDAIVRLAEAGVVAGERRQAVERLAGERRAAVAGAESAGAVAGAESAGAMDFPTPAELRAAMLSGRREP